MSKPVSPLETFENLASEKVLLLLEPEKTVLSAPSALQAPSWPTSRSRSTSMSEKPAEWCGMSPPPLTSCTPRVSQALALVGWAGCLWGPRERDSPGRRLGAGAASRHTHDGEGGRPGWRLHFCWGWQVVVELLSRLGIQEKEQEGEKIDFMLNKGCLSVCMWMTFSFTNEEYKNHA